MNNINVAGMLRTELMELRDRIDHELDKFRPYRIKERLVKCNRADCWCFETDEYHGPYLYVTYRKEGKTKTMSLGPKMSEQEVIGQAEASPNVWSYLVTPDHIYQKMPVETVGGWVYIEMSDREFLARYGVTVNEDSFDRPKKFWGSAEEKERYFADVDIYNERIQLRYNRWLGWGVGTLNGVAKLTVLEGEGYYQA